MKIAFSPCPNDTFIFHAWVNDLIDGAPGLDVTYADIDTTNRLAASIGGPDVVKISYAALPWVLSEYALLPCGGALGRGCGPLILTSERIIEEKKRSLAGENSAGQILAGRRVAIPSERSTAYLLFRLWEARHVPGGVKETVVMPFQEIMPAVRSGTVDAGLVIHEARFTYPSYGLKLLIDLGNWWETDTNLPVPLGAIIARRSLDLKAVAGWIRSSLQYAREYPAASGDYILSHAQELSPEVVRAHIDLYVNEFSADLGEQGREAVAVLLERAVRERLVPAFDRQGLYG
ncbi:hypothetical protein Sgly_3169 [Syntrophobotulus glycolicus DSM 8271]|uniref:1,4-dihydroxy-6-naphtoate synthase n=1 Tax=Syntrophobotulus glycolicus (strain DSM 8271 / FlGlyR) TaxID=645991 RepID=F0T1L1_SYNGF|nr:1,4-dihydroxy-6-naphthoate synthase [Syntrophobotulus glycolicus]ADY57435.1 hypothetical protein Sgly_3169 [Syntrophobotulus glycolicus DSM 8271]